jgi:hypothetical protein
MPLMALSCDKRSETSLSNSPRSTCRNNTALPPHEDRYMAKIILLTSDYLGKPIYINLDAVRSFAAKPHQTGTVLHFVDGKEIGVIEPANEIFRLADGVELTKAPTRCAPAPNLGLAPAEGTVTLIGNLQAK